MAMFIMLSSCMREDVYDATTISLTLDGELSLTRAVDASNSNPTIVSMRVLVFGENNSIVSNALFNGNVLSFRTDENKNYIVSINSANAPIIEANVGKNHVYVVLNEATGGLTTALNEVQTLAAMEQIRQGKVEYTTLIPVEKGSEAEPAFVMCVHDEVDVAVGATNLDLTGLKDQSYGFPMRRTMARVVLESIVGGVRPNGTIVGTSTLWDGNANQDQLGGDDKNNAALIASSAIHIQNVELINIPTHYSWKQEESDADTYTNYDGAYRTDPTPIATSDFHLTNRYFNRIWPGSIAGEGNVKFTRIDAMYSFFKIQSSSGSGAYDVFNPSDLENNPDAYYYWKITGGGLVEPSKRLEGNGKMYEITYSDAMKTASNFSHYTIDANGIVHLYDISGREFDAPNNSMYTLNKGNFIEFFKANYDNMSGNFTPGRPVAGELTSQADINPAVWKLNFDPVSYYIPENITNSNQTKIRITASIAYPTVVLDEELVNDAINAGGGTGDLVGEEGKLDMSDGNIINYLYAKGQMLPHPTEEGYYALAYAGLSRMYEGTVHVTGGVGTYEGIVGTAGVSAQVVTIEIPLNNENATDHNIYRGHEYRVRLYVNRNSQQYSSTNQSNRSNVSMHRVSIPAVTRSGVDDELCLWAEVETIPIEEHQ